VICGIPKEGIRIFGALTGRSASSISQVEDSGNCLVSVFSVFVRPNGFRGLEVSRSRLAGKVVFSKLIASESPFIALSIVECSCHQWRKNDRDTWYALIRCSLTIAAERSPFLHRNS